MTLCCKVHNDVDLLAAEDVVEKICGADVTLDEFDVQKRFERLQIFQAGAIVEFIQNNDLGKRARDEANFN